LASRADILAKMPPTPPFALTEQEAAAMCCMARGYFKAHCSVQGVERGKAILYPYDEVKAWFRDWWLAQSGKVANDPTGEDWTERFGDDQDAA
jgi:hypothetical protein